MSKAHKLIAIFFIASILIVALLSGVYVYKKSKADICNPVKYKISDELAIELPAGTIFYYSTNCPHCKLVEEFMQNNSIESKINITQKEVSQNETAANEMIKLQSLCKIPGKYISSVPLLYSNSTCYLGDKDIICILKKEAGVK